MLPLLKPRTAPDDMLAWIQLIRSPRVGPVNFHRLMKTHGSATAALAALPDMAAQAGIKDYAICPPKLAERELKDAQKRGAKPLLFGAADYPPLLAQIPDAPPILWALGQIELASKSSVTLIGGRDPSSLALRMAHKLARDLADAGIITLSGLARGIDTAVHQATEGRGSIAVLPCGLNTTYPAQNTDLAQALGQHGLILSEHPFDAVAQKHQFISRNRIVAGIAPICTVIEAAQNSGSLNCANTAADYGREVMAVPGHPLDPRCAGSNQLIKSGAGVVTCVDDILNALPQTKPVAAAAKPRPACGDISHDIIQTLRQTPLREDALCRALNADISALSAALLRLRMDGQIHRDPDGVLYI